MNPTLSLSNLIGRLTNIPNAIKAKESVVNLAMPHSDEAKQKIDKCIELIIYKNIIRLLIINLFSYQKLLYFFSYPSPTKVFLKLYLYQDRLGEMGSKSVVFLFQVLAKQYS